jgi:hypothetical protein
MLLRQTITLMTMLALSSQFVPAQEKEKWVEPEVPIARLSYKAGHIHDWRQEQGNPQICLALYRDRSYRILRFSPNGKITENGLETRAGRLSESEFQQLRDMLKDLDFQSKGSGLVRKDAAVFAAEVNLRDRTLRHVWGNPDNLEPFPGSSERVVRWLREFKPHGAVPFERGELSDPICPALSENPLPLVSGLGLSR